MDIWDKQKRSEVMSKIRSKNTKPELIVRSALFRQGYRFRIHRKDLPGCPDIVFPGRRVAIFIHGCFWHLHQGCRDGTIPKTSTDQWKAKLERNVLRDKEHVQRLEELNWRVMTIWDCEIQKSLDDVIKRIVSFLNE